MRKSLQKALDAIKRLLYLIIMILFTLLILVPFVPAYAIVTRKEAAKQNLSYFEDCAVGFKELFNFVKSELKGK